MWRTAGIGLFLVSVLLFWAWQHFELLRHGYRFEQMQRQYAAEVEINRHLRLDIYALRSPARIERMATRQLGLVTPAAADAVVVERVLPSPAPPSSALARK
jgi:cell division protein FtsL